eukprot:1134535-Pelagomonas_calceolata.AAC.4
MSPFSKCINGVRSIIPKYQAIRNQYGYGCMPGKSSSSSRQQACGSPRGMWIQQARETPTTSSMTAACQTGAEIQSNSNAPEADIAGQQFKLFAVDLETTCESRKRIIELAIVPLDIQPDQGRTSYSSLVNPGSPFKRNYIS